MAGVEELKNFINGEFVSCSNLLDSYNPATGKVHLRIPDSGKEEVDAAVQAAKEAFKKSVPNPWKDDIHLKVLFLNIAGGLRLLPRSAPV